MRILFNWLLFIDCLLHRSKKKGEQKKAVVIKDDLTDMDLEQLVVRFVSFFCFFLRYFALFLQCVFVTVFLFLVLVFHCFDCCLLLYTQAETERTKTKAEDIRRARNYAQLERVCLFVCVLFVSHLLFVVFSLVYDVVSVLLLLVFLSFRLFLVVHSIRCFLTFCFRLSGSSRSNVSNCTRGEGTDRGVFLFVVCFALCLLICSKQHAPNIQKKQQTNKTTQKQHKQHHLRNIEAQMEKKAEEHRQDIRVYLQKVIHLDFEVCFVFCVVIFVCVCGVLFVYSHYTAQEKRRQNQRGQR